jgi:hypothetical protein
VCHDASVHCLLALVGAPPVMIKLCMSECNVDLLFMPAWALSLLDPLLTGASFLMLSSILLTLETQHHWWIPRPLSLGWNVGFW